MKIIKQVWVAGLIACAVFAASADVVVTYNFNVSNATQNASISGTTPPDVSSTTLSPDAGTFATDWNIEDNNPTGDASNYLWVDASLGNLNYFEFTVTANSGAFNVTAASIDMRHHKNFDGAATFALRSNLDDYASDLLSGSNNRIDWVNYSGAISGVENQTSTTFRLYVGSSKDRQPAYDNLGLTLTPGVIPEPATLGMVASAGVLLMLLRRRLSA